jgi:stage II sporulation protein D
VPSAGAFDLVNVVGLDDYLLGVVPREMPASWGDDSLAALVAQAVAARSYALATLKPTANYDLFDDDRSQVYGGVAAEDPRTTRAVQSTRGTVLTYDGAVITAFFFSTSGGRTEDVQNVFRSGPRPYLVSVPDPYDRISPYHDWPDPPGDRCDHRPAGRVPPSPGGARDHAIRP